MTKLIFLRALTEAIGKMAAAVAAIADDDFDSAERELVAVHEILETTARELRAA